MSLFAFRPPCPVECLPRGISAVRRNPLWGIPQGEPIPLGSTESKKQLNLSVLSVSAVNYYYQPSNVCIDNALILRYIV